MNVSKPKKTLTPEHRAKISYALKGKKFTQEHLANLSRSHLGNQSSVGRVQSEQTRKKISEAARGHKRPWRGGKYKDKQGYIHIYMPDHPNATKQKYVPEHRLVMETYLGRVLLPSETVRHINGIMDDNRIENLMLFSLTGDHTQFRWYNGSFKNNVKIRMLRMAEEKK